ncbi:hypothetical protein Tco_0285110 [Tanacetum coccineum]
MFVFFVNTLLQNTMAEQNVPTQPPTRTDEQIVPRSQWLIIGKSNLLFNAQKIQKNPIFQISVDILSNTNFFRAFTASASVPAIYLQQFWNTMKYDEKTGVYRCQIDEQWFDLSADLLRKALAITPVIPAQPFELPPSGNTVIDFVNELGYPEPVEIVSNIRVNYVYQPWRAILTFNHQCLKERAVMGRVYSRDLVHYSTQSSTRSQSMKKSKNEYLEMVAENTKKTPQESASVQPATKHATPKKPTTTTPVKQSKPAPAPTKKPSKHKLPQKVRKGKPTFQLVDEDDEAQQESIPQEEGDDPDLELAKKMSLEAHQEKGEGEGDDADMERAIKLSLDPAFLPQGRAPVGGVTIRDPVSETTPKLHEVVGKGKAVVTEEQVAHSLIDLSKKKRTTDQFILVRRDQTPHDSTTGPSSQPEDDTSEKVIHESSSTSDSERTESETEAAAPKDLEPMKEDQTGSDSGKLHVSLVGPNPEHMDDEFLATAQTNRGSLYSTIPIQSHQTVTSTPPVIAPFIDVSSTKPSSLVTTPPINTEATTITTSLPEITPFIALQLRVARLEQEMSEVKKTDHSADVLALIKSQVPTAVDKYLGTKLVMLSLRS